VIILNNLHAKWPLWFLFALSFILSACGGGGGGGSSPGFSVSTNSLSFSASSVSSPTPVPQKITVTVTSGTVFLAALYGGDAISNATFSLTGATTGEVTIYPAAPGTLGPGTHTGTVSVLGCNDINCTSQVSGSPKDVTVTYDIEGLTVSPSSVNLSSTINTASTTAQSTLSSSLGSASWSSNVTYTGATSGWLTLSPSSGNSLPQAIDFSAAGLSTAGTYSATVTLTSGANQITLPVNYVVNNSLNPSPSTLSYTINDNPQASDLTRQLSSGAFTGVTWTASTDVVWLDLSPTSGNSSTTITASLDQTQINTLSNGTYTGTITLTPSVGSAETVTVTLVISRAQVNYVTPYVATTSTVKEVIVRGDNFIQAAIQNVKFGTTNADSFTFVSSTEILATHPALAAGSYDVSVTTTTGDSKTLATLQVVDAPAFAATSIAYPNTVTKRPLEIIYDAERQALLVAVAYPSAGASGDILRYSYSSGTWSATPASVFVPAFRDMGISTDGQQVIAVSNYAITQFDPITLLTGTSTSAPFSSFYYLKNVAFGNNGDALVTTGLNGSGITQSYRYNARAPALGSIGTSPNNTFYFGTPGVSADGSNITVVQGSLSPAPRVVKYNASDDTLSNSGISLNQNFLIPPELNRNANRIILNGYLVYDENYLQLGSLPFSATQAAIVLSPDGTKAYRYVSGTTLNTYDLSSAPVGGIFPELGGGTTLPSNPGTSPRMTISPDGGSLFIAGDSGIVVLPAP